MTEEHFKESNQLNWGLYEYMLESWREHTPNELGQAYLSVCSDLAYAQSHYPDTPLCRYLNALALQFHHILYRRQPQRWAELIHFFCHTVPMSFYKSRRYLLLSLMLLVLGEAVGIISQNLDKDYFEWFFGSEYYSVTMSNIRKGNPMGIYGMCSEVSMYFDIAFNNIKVGIIYFISGILTPFYVVYQTIMTGVMDGCFTTFFFQNGCGTESLVAPNEHGSLEIPAIIVCSAAGMRLGMGWFFPGKLTRMRALVNSAEESCVMMLAMIPVFAVAAFIESFITRHQEWPMYVRLLFVFGGLMLSVYYIVVLPLQIKRKEGKRK